jgi:uncharacterized protein (TIGR02246 family)
MKGFVFAAALTALSACAAIEEEPDPAAGIAASSTVFEAAFNSGDAAGLAAIYTEDAALLPPDMAQIDGREGIQALWQGFMDAGVSDIDLNTVELEVHGTSASEVGTYTLTAPDGEGGRVTAGGKYIVLWQLGDDGVWRLHRDIWNSNSAG